MSNLPASISIEPVNVARSSDEFFVYNVMFDGRLVVSIELDFATHNVSISPIDPDAASDIVASEPFVNVMHFVGMCVAECGILAAQSFDAQFASQLD